MEEVEVKETNPVLSVLSGAPTFLWALLIVGGILAIQLYAPPEMQLWGNLATVALVMLARYIGISGETVYTLVALVGGKEGPKVPGDIDVLPAGAPMPAGDPGSEQQVAVVKKVSAGRRLLF